MMRARVLGLACALSLAAGTARAQAAFYLGHLPTDSTLGVLTTPTTVDVRLGLGAAAYVTRAYLTVHYDPTQVQVLGAFGVTGDSIIGVDSSHAGAFAFTFDGCLYSYDSQVARLRLQLTAAATSGAVVYLTSDSAVTTPYCGQGTTSPAAFASAMTSLCTAAAIYGDVDNSLAVDSRDALIALSAAVGLPVTGFNLANGDVDGDGLVNSRDALIMLSYAVGLSTGTARVAMGVPVACPANAPAGEQFVVRARGSNTLYDTVGVIGAAATTLTMVPGLLQPVAPRLAADGISIVAPCSAFYVEICRIRTDGTGYHSFFTDGYYGSPDWNPAGDSIAMIRFIGGASWPAVIDSGGGGLRQLSANAVMGRYWGAIAWNRSGTSIIAYVRSDGTIWTVHPDSTADAQLPIAGVTDAASVRWSPAGDSLAFTRLNEPGIWVVAAAGGTPAQRTSFRSNGFVSGYPVGFDWGPQGLLFAAEEPGRMGVWLLAPTGALWRVTSGPHIEPSFRRNP